MQSNSTSVAVPRPRSSRRRRRRFIGARLVWGGLLRILQRMTRYKRGDKLEFRLSFSVRDLLSDAGGKVKEQVEALVQAVQKAGSYQAREEAARAVHAVLDGLKGCVSPDVLAKLSEAAPVREAARVGRAVSQRFQKEATAEQTAGTASLSGVETREDAAGTEGQVLESCQSEEQ